MIAAQSVVLAVDAGTTNTKALLLDPETGSVLASTSTVTDVRFPAPGWVEQDPEQLVDAALRAVDSCFASQSDVRLAGIGLTSQRESVVCWSRATGKALGPALSWQDARTDAWCRELADEKPQARELIRARTGLTLDPMFSAPKMRACVDTALAAGARLEDLAVGTVDSWLIWNLTGEYVTEVGNASRTMLLSLDRLDWDDQLLSLFGLARGCLPEVRPSDAGFGHTLPGRGRVPAGVPLLAVLADSHASLYHHGCTAPGMAKATYGTGTSVMVPVQDRQAAPEGISTTIAWQVGGAVSYAREGNVLATGSALDWMARMLGARGTAGGAYLTQLAAEVADTGGVTFVPAFAGLGAPYWDRQTRGIVAGLSGGTERGHLARAALEAVAHQVVDVVEAMEQGSVARLKALRVDGGATSSSLLMQIQADLLGLPLVVADVPSASALGVGQLASRVLGFATPPTPTGTFVAPRSCVRAARRSEWARAVARARGARVSPAPVDVENKSGRDD